MSIEGIEARCRGLTPIRVLRRLRTVVAGFARSDDGVTAIEYGLLASGIAVAILLSVIAMGEDLTQMFEGAHTSIEDARGG
jgi:pilus assembly protein Flp/PilA